MISTMPLTSVTFVFFWPRRPRESGNLTSVHFALTSGSRDVTSDTSARSQHLAVTSAKSQHLAVTAARQLRPRDHPDVKANCFDVKFLIIMGAKAKGTRLFQSGKMARSRHGQNNVQRLVAQLPSRMLWTQKQQPLARVVDSEATTPSACTGQLRFSCQRYNL
jgi:hypothetical protein